MSRPKPVMITRGRRSAYIEPASPAVRAAVDRVGSPSQYDRKLRALAVPIARADDVEASLVAAGVRVDVVLGLGRSS